jgi:sugar fermentation stimulation protein A
MQFKQELIHGKLIQRYKRFLADVELDNGEVVTAHCTNSGTMKSCLEQGAEVYLSPVNDPKRKTKFTWEMIKIDNGWVGINTSNPNLLAFEAIRDQKIAGLRGYEHIRREVKFGDSRIDVVAENDKEKCVIEVKNVTMKEGICARFPDAVTARGKKHLETLTELKARGFRTVMLYVIQRSDIQLFGPAWEIDPAYSEALVNAMAAGVEIFPVMAQVTPQRIEIKKIVPFDLAKP